VSRGLLLVGHGSHLNADSSAPVRQHAAAIRALGLFDEVRTGFWKEEPNLSRALDPFQSDDITVVPVFISAGYFTNEVIPREMALMGECTEIRGKPVRYTPPIGSHPALAKVILQRAREAGGQPGDTLAVLGHGTPRNPDSERNVYAQAENVRALGGFREVITVFLDQEPNMRDIFALTAAETVVIVPLFVADGWHVGETIPEDLALDGPETRREGRRLKYAGAVGTHPSVVDVILELAGGETRPATNGAGKLDPPWYDLHVDGMGEGWGMPFWQFRIHRDEQSLILHPLAHNGDPIQGEEIGLDEVAVRCRYDDLGRYRPLSGALTVPTGWYARFHERKQAEEILDDLYPLGPLHWTQWEDQSLRVIGLDEVLNRQTGRYASAKDLSHDGREAVRWALCDHRCDRAPLWADGDLTQHKLDPWAVTSEDRVINGDVPCPEPCSVFVSLCREAAIWEKERPEPAPVDTGIAWAAFDEPGNEVREAYLKLRFGDTVSSDG
jgi:sirohydrochlorin cobaltochelatase